MATKKISELPLADALTGSEVIPVVQGGVTRKATPDQLADLIADVIIGAEATTALLVTEAEAAATAAETSATSASTAASTAATEATAAEAASSAAAAAAAEAQAAADVTGSDGTTSTLAYAGEAATLPGPPVGYRKVLIDGIHFAIPYYHWGKPLDVNIIVGQSNAQGHGDSTLSPAAPNGVYINNTTGVISEPLADPVGGANTGSMWPAYANAWFDLTGRYPAFVECATGSTALLAAADGGSGNWSPTGTLRAVAAADAARAIAAVNASEDYTLGTVRFIWAQGEQDAENFVGFTGEDYEQALEDLAAYFKAQVPEMEEMCVIQSARNGVTGLESAEWAAIRQAQKEACDDSALLRMACTAALSMTYRTPQWMDDAVHYDQAALNMIGQMAAYEIVSPDTVPFTPNITSTVDNYSGAAILTRTISGHTCEAGTKSIIISVGIGKTSSSTGSVTGITFGGKSFRQAQKAGSNWASVPASAAQASIWILDEDDYEATLGGATGDIIVTLNATNGIIVSTSILESDEALVIESHDWTADVTGTIASISTNENYNNSPAFMVTCIAGRLDSATPNTYTFNRGTEVTDYGYNLDTRSYSVATVYEVLAAASFDGATVTATPSASMVHAGIVTACFRRRFAGETAVA